MNIFALFRCPSACVRDYYDQHVVKMCLETAQLLYGVHHVVSEGTGWEEDARAHLLGSGAKRADPYRLTHRNHPCAIWARTSVQNYLWLASLGLSLSAEYSRRFDGRVHACTPHLLWLAGNVPPGLSDGGLTEHVRCCGNAQGGDTYEAYRTLYVTEKRHLRFARREGGAPSWWHIPSEPH